MTPPLHVYHVHVGHGHVSSRWEPVVEEHFRALRDAQFEGRVGVGLVGDQEKRTQAIRMLDKLWPDWWILAAADEGFEQPTIDAMHRVAKDADPATPVLYCHTKGAFQDTPFNRAWRRGMTSDLVGFWQACVMSLNQYDVIGRHWLTHEEFPKTITNGNPMFAGNFWWARAGYLAGLPPVQGGEPGMPLNRYKAEDWIGQGNPSPKVLDLHPGWPDYHNEDDGGYDSVKGGQRSVAAPGGRGDRGGG